MAVGGESVGWVLADIGHLHPFYALGNDQNAFIHLGDTPRTNGLFVRYFQALVPIFAKRGIQDRNGFLVRMVPNFGMELRETSG